MLVCALISWSSSLEQVCHSLWRSYRNSLGSGIIMVKCMGCLLGYIGSSYKGFVSHPCKVLQNFSTLSPNYWVLCVFIFIFYCFLNHGDAYLLAFYWELNTVLIDLGSKRYSSLMVRTDRGKSWFFTDDLFKIVAKTFIFLHLELWYIYYFLQRYLEKISSLCFHKSLIDKGFIQLSPI